jgi:alkanesulfonate monooxygenase SsuD/methylene tetrahydromethanopterin reductase-like flavin-dependent oxidoreductase (luciferase family)
VKVINFNFMSYPYLPEDFPERSESVWLTFDPDMVDADKLPDLFNRYLDELEYAAEVGFDGVCVNEHHCNVGHLMASPNLMAAALARRTVNAALVVLGTSIALYNPPLRVAEEYAILDAVSRGRMVAGFPTGTPMDTAYAYGINPSELRERYTEAHDLIKKAWTTPGPWEWNGRFHQLRYVNTALRPAQTPHPPIWVPGASSVETWDFCALNDYVYCYLTFFGYLTGAQIIERYWDTVKKHGKDPNPYRLGMTQFVAVADSKKEALELYAEPANYFFRNMLHVAKRFGNPPGYSSEVSTRKAIETLLKAPGAGPTSVVGPSFTSSLFEDMIDKGWILVGSPTEVTERLVDQCTAGNIGNLIALTSFGSMSPELARYNTKIFADQVLPELHKLHTDWEHLAWPSGATPAANLLVGAGVSA